VSADRLLTVVLPDGKLAASYAVGPGPLDVAVYEDEPVPVAVTRFAAVRSDAGAVELSWTIEGDALVGCHVERRSREAGDRDFLRLTVRELEGDRGRYRFTDASAGSGALVYRLIGIARNGMFDPLGVFHVAGTAPPESGAPAFPPLAIAARPNPSRVGPGARVDIEVTARLDEPAAEVIVFSVTGRPLRRLHLGPLEPGVTRLGWDGRDSGGQPVPAGVYVVRLVTDDGAVAAKVTLIR
jgi:hypothetical protein